MKPQRGHYERIASDAGEMLDVIMRMEGWYASVDWPIGYRKNRLGQLELLLRDLIEQSVALAEQSPELAP